MIVAIHGRQIDPAYQPEVFRLLQLLCQNKISVFIHKPFLHYLSDIHIPFETFTTLPANTDCLISFGGDGTFLESVCMSGSSGTPVFGINTGRLGFLSTVPLHKTEEVIKAILNRDYYIEERTLLKASACFLPADHSPYALNDVGIQRYYPSMISMRVSINGEILPDYWGDGLLVATPTGSTAYSMSAGGPIVASDTQNIIITPIASHNLNVRPLVIDDKSVVKVQVRTRKPPAVVSIDNRIYETPSETEIQIEKADFTTKIIRFQKNSFFPTLREKLSWGIDKRNPHD